MQPKRTIEEIRAEMLEVSGAQKRLRLLVGQTLRTIKAKRFKPHDPATGKRHPAFKDLREYESTLRSADRHMARLRAEESKLEQQAATQENAWAEFAPPAKA